MRKPAMGALLGVGCTVLSTMLALLAASVPLPDLALVAAKLLALPFVWVGGLLTYYLIVGDNLAAEDFYRYTLPLSLVLNTSAGLLAGWLVERGLTTRNDPDPKP